MTELYKKEELLIAVDKLKLRQTLMKDINTTNNYQNTTESSLIATNGSGIYLHSDNVTK